MKIVLFVCVHNAGRSQMAEAFLNRQARGEARAISAGSQPANDVDPGVIEVMNEVGIDISLRKPKRLIPQMLDSADYVVTMGCGVETSCPVTTADTEDWRLDDPSGKPIEKVREIRNQIQVRVTTLMKSIG
jgi:protein-tyrosine-phosphatase